MSTSLLIGNFFSLLSAICIAISVFKKSKKDLMLWQVVDIVFIIISNIFLGAYAAATSNSLGFVRNLLTYKGKLTKNMTAIFFVLCIVMGAWSNNLGIIGWLAIAASSSYTIFLYTTKNDQQMRWALVSNLALWLIHDVYVQAYPSALMDTTLSIWTLIQIYKNHKRFAV